MPSFPTLPTTAMTRTFVRLPLRLATIALLGAITIGACSSPDAPSEPSGDSAIPASRFTGFPRTGGWIYRLEVTADGIIYVFNNGRIEKFHSIDAAPQQFGTATVYEDFAVSPGGEIVAMRYSDIHTYAPESTTPTVASRPQSYYGEVPIAWAPNGDIYAISNPHWLPLMMRTTNRGVSWDSVLVPDGLSAGSLAFDRAGTLYLMTRDGLYVSSDRGATWGKRAPLADGTLPGRLIVGSDGTIYTWHPESGRLARLRDGDATFVVTAPSAQAPYVRDLAVGNGGDLIALIDASGSPFYLAGIYRSGDGGTTWSLALPVQGTDLAVAGRMIALGTPNGVLLSTDDGGSWSMGGLAEAASIEDLDFDRDGNMLVIVDEKLYHRTNSRWSFVATGSNVAVTPLGTIGLMHDNTTLLRSSDNGRTWSSSRIVGYQRTKGWYAVPGMVGRSSGDFLLSMTSYDGRHNDGALFNISASGQVTRVPNTETFDHLVQDRTGRIYGSTVRYDSGAMEPIRTLKYTLTGGAAWDSVPVKAAEVGMVFNSRNDYLRVQRDLLHYRDDGLVLGTVGGSERAPRQVEGLPQVTQRLQQIIFGPDDRLYMIVKSYGGLYVSSGPVR